MGLCFSTDSLERHEYDENIVYVVDEGLSNTEEDGMRRVASLYSQQGKKGPNQDSAILWQGYGMEEAVFCGVFDGHGRNGHMISKLVRNYLPSLLLNQHNALSLANSENAFSESCDSSSVEGDDSPASSPEMFDEWKEACVNAFKAMDKELKLQQGLDCSFSGTTAVTIVKQGKDLIIANLGDSRAVLGTVGDDGRMKAVPLTTDLKPSVPHEAKRIKKNNGRIFALKDEPGTKRVWLPNNNFPGLAMARAFGDFQMKNYGIIATPQVSYRRLTERDQFIILATDGVWDVLSNQQVISVVSSVMNKQEASKAVVEAAIRAWKRKFPTSKIDDCSVVCLFLQDGKTAS